MSEVLDKQKLIDLLRTRRADAKWLVFVNERKHCDGIAKVLQGEHIRCGVLHAGLELRAINDIGTDRLAALPSLLAAPTTTPPRPTRARRLVMSR